MMIDASRHHHAQGECNRETFMPSSTGSSAARGTDADPKAARDTLLDRDQDQDPDHDREEGEDREGDRAVGPRVLVVLVALAALALAVPAGHSHAPAEMASAAAAPTRAGAWTSLLSARPARSTRGRSIRSSHL